MGFGVPCRQFSTAQGKWQVGLHRNQDYTTKVGGDILRGNLIPEG